MISEYWSKVLHGAVDKVMSWNAHWGWISCDRKTGRLEREKQSLRRKVKLLLLFNPLTEWVDTTQAMRLYTHNRTIKQGQKEGTLESRKDIKRFVEEFGIDMNEYEPSDINAYSTFEDFFVRAHKDGSRPIHEPQNPAHAVVAADSRVVAYESVAETKDLWIKGKNFSISTLVMDTDLGSQFDGAAVASFRLSPQDYHRYHSPVSGKIKAFRSIPGDYYQVDAIALQSDVDILTRNRRVYLVIETESFGDVLFVAIGATNVGSVKFQQIGTNIAKGDELGHFQFGGSSIIVAFQNGRISFDQDLLDLSKQRIQVAVDMGMSLGYATN
ncbi:unnamed protein product [Clonostachys rosea f. rosea IK726]|uniref:Uncharacterized protein n=1 Tax=Clonostachys rosea f. rosea IK726 TaxID=1349383 RepID=A0ACA9TF12_BIOOC|nr:unnamed protein product [Clonostachys rosea f. rosea IK726]